MRAVVQSSLDITDLRETLDTAALAVDAGLDLTIVKVGWGPYAVGFGLDPLVQQALTLSGCFSHTWPVPERVIRLLSTRELDPRPLISHVAPPGAWRVAFEGMHSGAFATAVLQP